MTQAVLVMLALMIVIPWIVKLCLMAVVGALIVAYFKLCKWLNAKRVKVDTTYMKLNHKFIFTRGRGFWLCMCILSAVTYIGACWATWLIDHPGQAVHNEVAEYLSPENSETFACMLNVLPAYVTRPATVYAVTSSAMLDYINLAQEYKESPDSFTDEDLEDLNLRVKQLEDLQEAMKEFDSKLDMYVWLPCFLWVLHGLTLYPASIRNEVLSYEKT